jgi:hypothetical protein
MKDEALSSDKEYDQLPTTELLELLRNKSKLSKGRALAALARRTRNDVSLVREVISAISDPANQETRIMGTISVSHIGVACLLEFGSSRTKELVKQLLEHWPEPDRSDLLWFLKSESISIDETDAT